MRGCYGEHCTLLGRSGNRLWKSENNYFLWLIGRTKEIVNSIPDKSLPASSRQRLWMERTKSDEWPAMGGSWGSRQGHETGSASLNTLAELVHKKGQCTSLDVISFASVMLPFLLTLTGVSTCMYTYRPGTDLCTRTITYLVLSYVTMYQSEGADKSLELIIQTAKQIDHQY